jgi:hypothetical protein
MLLAVTAALAFDAAAEAQRRGRGIGYYLRTPTPQSFDGTFNFCRAMSSYIDAAVARGLRLPRRKANRTEGQATGRHSTTKRPDC